MKAAGHNSRWAAGKKDGADLPMKKRLTIRTRLSARMNAVPAAITENFLRKGAGKARTAEQSTQAGSSPSQPLRTAIENWADLIEAPTTWMSSPKARSIAPETLAFAARYSYSNLSHTGRRARA